MPEVSVVRPGDVSYLRIAAPDEARSALCYRALQPYPEGDLWVAMPRDPAGNAIGIPQRGPRPGQRRPEA
jgi:hypothetical protein